MSDESIKPPATSNNTLDQELNSVGNKIRAKFDGSCSKQDKITFNHGNIANIYIFYQINLWNRGFDDYPVLENSLFVAVNLTKNPVIDKYKYTGYGIGFDRRGTFTVPGGSDKNVIFDVDRVPLDMLITKRKIS